MNLICKITILLTGLLMLTTTYAADKKFDLGAEISLLRRADMLPTYRTGIVEQISSYDTTGGNNDGFSGQYSYIRKENGKLVIADLKGPGVINRIWTPTPTNDTLSFYFDAEKTPRLVVCFNDLFSGKVFPFVKPICGNEVGGFYCYLPIPYRKSCKIVFGGERIMFHQIQYRDLSGYDVTTYDKAQYESLRGDLEKTLATWADISPVMSRYAEGSSAGYMTEEKTFLLQAGDETAFFEKTAGGRVTGLEINGGRSFEGLEKDIILKAVWDDESTPAVYAPLADFFGYAYGKPAMRSMLIGSYGETNYCFFPFPFDKNAKISLIYKKRQGSVQSPVQITAKTFYNDVKRDKDKEGRFYTNWKREIRPADGKYYCFADLKGKGHYVGTVHWAQGLRAEMTQFFEGDDSTYVDGKMRMHGTGSEDYYNGGWYALLDRWDRGISLPLHGSLDYSLPLSRTGGYRFYMADKMTFEKELFVGIEHGPEGNRYPVDYASIAFYYSDNAPTAVSEPSEELRTVYIPSEHSFYPQLMDITLGSGVRAVHQRGLRLYAADGGMVRIMLNDIPEGVYTLSLSYFDKPTGADFCVWQRQKQLSDWKSTKAQEEKLQQRQAMGEITVTPQTNSISIHIRKNGGGDEFEIERIYLEKIKN